MMRHGKSALRIAVVLTMGAAMICLAGCATLPSPEAEPLESEAGYIPRKGDWCQYSVHGNLQLRILILEVDQRSVYLAREFSAAGEMLRSEQAQVPLDGLRGFVSDSYREAEWTDAGADVLRLRGEDYRAAVLDTPSNNGGTLRVWVVDEIPVTGVALVREMGQNGMSIDTMKATNWGRFDIAE